MANIAFLALGDDAQFIVFAEYSSSVMAFINQSCLTDASSNSFLQQMYFIEISNQRTSWRMLIVSLKYVILALQG
jgi:hypothetical protein